MRIELYSEFAVLIITRHFIRFQPKLINLFQECPSLIELSDIEHVRDVRTCPIVQRKRVWLL